MCEGLRKRDWRKYREEREKWIGPPKPAREPPIWVPAPVRRPHRWRESRREGFPRGMRRWEKPSKHGVIKSAVKWIAVAGAVAILAVLVFYALVHIERAVSVNTSELEKEVFGLINQKRIAYGLEPLEWNDQLADVARLHSRDMAENNFFSHQNLRGENPEDRLIKKGIYSPAGEVLHQQSRFSFIIPPIPKTQGQLAGDTVDGWMNSPRHRMIILGSFSKVGVGVWEKDFSTTYFFTALLIL
jgi:uncharacterized protein YkwD